VSISESEDCGRRGISPAEVTRATIRIAEIMTCNGVALTFGHDWRPEGVMDSLYAYVRHSHLKATPFITNYLAWPDTPQLSQAAQTALRPAVQIVSVGLPGDVAAAKRSRSPGRDRFLRVRALTHMRRTMSDRTSAQLCIGGRVSGYQGRWPGVIEEAFIASVRGKPLYVSEVFGGAAAEAVAALRHRRVRRRSTPSPDLVAAFERFGRGRSANYRLDLDVAMRRFESFGVTGLSRTNGLTVTENRQLLAAGSIDTVCALVLRGLANLREPG
jgi:hypothetical protein